MDVIVKLPENQKWVVKSHIGELVYAKTDLNQRPGTIIGINLKPGGSIVYVVCRDEQELFLYDVELSSTPNF